ncbi:Gfo/Idh/MocA family oxidoreductase [Kribbella sp. NPDC050820]|uniref:Gfo/Idh/MocA family protein n=1 Tax=Kribbella sp. NPDC050820 TaxID=3155408 RepID=UPI0033C0156B
MTATTNGTTATPPLRFAVLGCGAIGQHHASVIDGLDSAEVTVAIDVTEQAAQQLATRYDAMPVTGLTDALKRDDVDAVAICSPSGDHAQHAIAALDAGKHVVVEKPIDITLEAAAALAKAEEQSTGIVTVISQHRYDPSSRLVHDAVQSGKLGVPTSGVATVSWWRSQLYYDSGAWRGTKKGDGGGALINQSIHTIDLLVWMLGCPVEVMAYAACLAHTGLEVEDTAVAIMRFENGALGVVHGTTAAYPGLTARLQVHGSRGSAVIDGAKLAYFHAAADNLDAEEAPAYGAGADSNHASELLPDQNGMTAGSGPAAPSDAHSLQYADFVEAVRTGRAPAITVADAITTLSVVLSIYESAETGRPIPLPRANMS